MALLTLTQYKAILNITSSDKDSYYTTLITYADAAIKRLCRVSLESEERTEYYNPTNWYNITLNNRPVTLVTNVWYDPTREFSGDEQLLVNYTDYILRPDQPDGSSRCGLLEFIGSFAQGRLAWPRPTMNPIIRDEIRTIKVQYTAGYVTVPDDLKLATAMYVRELERSVRYAGSSPLSESLLQYSYQLAAAAPGIEANTSFKQLIKQFSSLGVSLR